MFDECQKIGNLKFEFLDKGNGTNYCVKLARTMPAFETNDELRSLIKSGYLYEEFDQKRVKEIGAMIADPKNTHITLLSKSFKEDSLPEHEPWYNIKYSSEFFKPEYLEVLTKAEVKDNGKKLGLPPPNNLIPTNFEVHNDNPEHSKQPVFAN